MTISNPENLFDFYRDTFIPAYSDFVGFSVTKPKQVLTEMENTLAHLAQYHNPKLSQMIREDNLRKAHDHLTRVTLDCYKLLWIKMDEELELFYVYPKKRIALNITEVEFLVKYNNFKMKAQTARKQELDSLGADPLIAVESYKEVIKLGKELMTCVDAGKLKTITVLQRSFLIKESGIGFVMGLLSGLSANAVWGYDPFWLYLRTYSDGFLNLLIIIAT